MDQSESVTETESSGTSSEDAQDAWSPVHPLDSAEEDGGWLPVMAQLRMAARLQLELAVGPDAAGVPFHRGLHTSMRQGFGLIGLVALLSTLSVTVATWFGVGDAGRFQPFSGITTLLSGNWSRLAELSLFGMDEATLENAVAGAPWLWALGAWLGAPIRLWTIWIVGGLLVFAVARMIGTHTTLPRFFAATSYAFLPLLLLLLLPMPVMGAIALVAALILAILAYAQGVQVATEMEWGHVVIAMALPAVLVGFFLIGLPVLILFA